MTTIIQEMTSASARYHDMVNALREFVKLHEVPQTLADRVMDYVVSKWSTSKGLDTGKVLDVSIIFSHFAIVKYNVLGSWLLPKRHES